MTSTAHTAGAAGVTLPELVEVVAGEVAPATGTLDLYLEDPSRAVRLGRAVESAPESVERALRAADDAHRAARIEGKRNAVHRAHEALLHRLLERQRLVARELIPAAPLLGWYERAKVLAEARHLLAQPIVLHGGLHQPLQLCALLSTHALHQLTHGAHLLLHALHQVVQ